MTPAFGSRGPQKPRVIETPEALEAFEREMRVMGERPRQLSEAERKLAAAPFIAALVEWARVEEKENAK